MSGPPKSWTELRDLLGEADARKLVDAFGGEGLCIPKNYDPKHHLARKLGRQAFTTLTRFWGGCPIYIPTMAGARRAIRDEGIRRKRGARRHRARDRPRRGPVGSAGPQHPGATGRVEPPVRSALACPRPVRGPGDRLVGAPIQRPFAEERVRRRWARGISVRRNGAGSSPSRAGASRRSCCRPSPSRAELREYWRMDGSFEDKINALVRPLQNPLHQGSSEGAVTSRSTIR